MKNAAPLPPFTAIRAFEAAARRQSFTRAAEELNMTPAAVSYQIKQLEQRLGVVLFRRLPRQVDLTEAGAKLAPLVLAAFESLRDAFSQTLERSANELSITSLPTIASSWLVPRLGDFKAANPHLAVKLDVSVPLADLDIGAFDVGLRSGLGEWPGMRAHLLFPNAFTPLCSPALRDGGHGLAHPSDLLQLPLLGRRSWWKRWFEAAGLPGAELVARSGVEFAIEHFAVTAAIAGHGVALVSPLFFRNEIASGQLVQPFDCLATTEGGYWLAYPETIARAPKIRVFAAWILSQAQASRDA